MVLRKGILNGVLKKRVISKILLSTILFVLVFGIFFSNFPNKVIAEDVTTPTPATSTNITNTNDIINVQLQFILGCDEYLTKITDEFKNHKGEPIINSTGHEATEDYYESVVNMINNLREAYVILAQNGYDQTKWQTSYSRLKKLINDVSTELVLRKGNDYIVRMVDTKHPEIVWNEYQVDVNATPEEKKKQEAAIADKITAQQNAATTEAAQKAAQKAAKNQPTGKECPSEGNSWLNFIDPSLGKVISDLPCIFVGFVLDVVYFIQKQFVSLFSSSVPLVPHITNSNFNISLVWKIILQLVDYCVVAFLIFISFANILRIQVDTYAIKKTIPTLVLGVIAANLSWFICKEIINFADILVQWIGSGLLTKANIANVSTSEGLFYALFHQIYDSARIGKSVIPLTGESLLIGLGLVTAFSSATFMIAIVGVILVSIPMAIFVILGFLFLARLVVVDFLIIVSPLAFIALAFPMTQKLFQQWWSQFTRWVFMAPLAYLLLAFAVFIGAAIGSNPASTTGTLDIILSGLLRYVMMGAAMYFAIKIPSMLGGGIMNAWGGLGTKFGKYLGRRAERQIGDWSQYGMKIGKRQLIKPMGGRYTPYTFFKGLVQRDQQLQQKHDVAGASTGQAVGDAFANAPGNIVSNWGELKNIWGNKGLTPGQKQAAIRNAIAPDLARGQYTEMIKQNRERGINRALNSGADDATLLSDLDNAINSGNANKAYEYLNAVAFRRLSLKPGTQDKFFKNITSADEEKYAVWQSAVGLNNSRDAQMNNRGGMAWANEFGLDKFGRLQKRNTQSVYEDMATNLENSDSFLKGGQTRTAATMLSKIQGREGWGIQEEGAYHFLEGQASRGNLDQAIFDSIKQKRSGFGATPAIQTATNNEWKTLLGEIEQGGDRGKVKIESHIEELEVALKTGKITEDATQAKLNLLHYLKNEEPELLKDLSVDSEKIGQAIGKFNYNPVMVARPRLEVEADDSWEKDSILSKLNGIPQNIEKNVGLAININHDRSKLEQDLRSRIDNMDNDVKKIIGDSKLSELKNIPLKTRLQSQGIKIDTVKMRQEINKFQRIVNSYEKLNNVSEVARNAGGVVGKWKKMQSPTKP